MAHDVGLYRYDIFREEEKEVEEKPDMTDFETFSNNFDKIEKQHRKAGKAMVKGGVSLNFKNAIKLLEIILFLRFHPSFCETA